MLIHDPAQLRLGRKARAYDPRTLRLADYLKPGALPPVPDAIDYGAKVKDFGMLKNDQLGDCTVAGLLHANLVWLSQAAPAPAFSDAYAVSLYEQLCGYKPGDPSTDQGGVELDILKAWRKAPLGGVQLDAFVSVNPRNWNQVKFALHRFGALYAGIALPLSAQTEDVWRSTKDNPGGWGGHCVILTAYRDRANCLDEDMLTCVTWGANKGLTRPWLSAYCDELYAPLPSTGWVGSTGEAPNHLNMEQLRADLARL